MAEQERGWQPDWTIAPASTLQEWMENNGMSPKVMAATWSRDRPAKGWAASMVQEVLDKKPLTEKHAEILERATFIPARVWLNLESLYRRDLAAGRKDVTDD